MRRVPIIPTVVVALCVAAMIALGLWQLLIRLPAKEAQLAQLAANPAKPPIAFPLAPDDSLLFRRSSVTCLPPVTTRIAGAGAAGFRVVADCRSAGGQGVAVQLGTTRNAMAKLGWAGGAASGYLTHAPDARPLIAGLWDHRPKALMLVADTPPTSLAPRLARNTPPDIAAVPNSHLAYAGQWFFFAAVATIIYTLALRRRLLA